MRYGAHHAPFFRQSYKWTGGHFKSSVFFRNASVKFMLLHRKPKKQKLREVPGRCLTGQGRKVREIKTATDNTIGSLLLVSGNTRRVALKFLTTWGRRQFFQCPRGGCNLVRGSYDNILCQVECAAPKERTSTQIMRLIWFECLLLNLLLLFDLFVCCFLFAVETRPIRARVSLTSAP